MILMSNKKPHLQILTWLSFSPFGPKRNSITERFLAIHVSVYRYLKALFHPDRNDNLDNYWHRRDPGEAKPFPTAFQFINTKSSPCMSRNKFSMQSHPRHSVKFRIMGWIIIPRHNVTSLMDMYWLTLMVCSLCSQYVVVRLLWIQVCWTNWGHSL